MGRIIANFFISLDGVVQDPQDWHFPYFDDEMGAVIGSGMETQRAFLMGRTLYDQWSAYWPGQGDEVPFASHINSVAKYVVTHRELGPEPWQNATAITEDHVTELQRVKDATDGDIAMSGCATTVRWLLANGLLDELALLVHPVAVAKGQRLFEGTGTVPLRLEESRALSSGVLHLRYTPA